jgi:hypothetical protein
MKSTIISGFSIAVLFLTYNVAFAQGPGVFNFNNNTDCDVYVTIYSYTGSCGGISCGSPIASYGPTLVYANSAVDVASGFSGSGDVWGKVSVNYLSSTTSAGSSTCTSSGSINCPMGGVSVNWDSCNGATIP